MIFLRAYKRKPRSINYCVLFYSSPSSTLFFPLSLFLSLLAYVKYLKLV